MGIRHIRTGQTPRHHSLGEHCFEARTCARGVCAPRRQGPEVSRYGAVCQCLCAFGSLWSRGRSLTPMRPTLVKGKRVARVRLPTSPSSVSTPRCTRRALGPVSVFARGFPRARFGPGGFQFPEGLSPSNQGLCWAHPRHSDGGPEEGPRQPNRAVGISIRSSGAALLQQHQ